MKSAFAMSSIFSLLLFRNETLNSVVYSGTKGSGQDNERTGCFRILRTRLEKMFSILASILIIDSMPTSAATHN